MSPATVTTSGNTLIHKGKLIIDCAQGSVYVAPSSDVEGVLGMSMVWAFKNFLYARVRVLLAPRQPVSLCYIQNRLHPH